MPSADRPETTEQPPPSPELSDRLSRLATAIDNVLAAGHTLRAGLKDDHLPLPATLADAVARYGAEPPVLALWIACKALEALRLVWTGK